MVVVYVSSGGTLNLPTRFEFSTRDMCLHFSKFFTKFNADIFQVVGDVLVVFACLYSYQL